MTFSIPPRPPPPPRLLHAEGEILQRIVLYAPSSVLRFVLFFLLIAIRLLLVLAVRFRVVLPGVPLLSLLAKGTENAGNAENGGSYSFPNQTVYPLMFSLHLPAM